MPLEMEQVLFLPFFIAPASATKHCISFGFLQCLPFFVIFLITNEIKMSCVLLQLLLCKLCSSKVNKSVSQLHLDVSQLSLLFFVLWKKKKKSGYKFFRSI